MESGSDATQDFSFYGSTSGTVTSDTVQHHTGPRSIKLFTSNPAVNALVTSGGVMSDSGTRISFWWMGDTFAATGPTILNFDDGANTIWGLMFNAGLNRLRSGPVGATAVDGTVPIATNTWYHITISYFITNSTTWQFKVYVNGVLDSTANSGTLTRTGTSRFQFRDGTGFGINATQWFDDVYVDNGASSSSQPDTGDIRVTAKRPNANGTTNGFTTQIGAGGSGYGTGHSPQVNEQPLSQTNGWSMIGAGSAVTEEYNIENILTGDVNILGITPVDVQGWFYAKSLAGETTQMIVNGTNFSQAITSTPTMYTKFTGATAYPAGTGTDIGITTDTSLTTVSLYEAGIQVAYKPYVFSQTFYYPF